MNRDRVIDVAINEGRTAALRVIADQAPTDDARSRIALLADLIDRQERCEFG